MNNDRISKNFKIKIDDMVFDSTAEKPITYRNEESLIVKNLHYHTMYELFYADEDPIMVYTTENVLQYEKCLILIPPFCKHRTHRKSGLRILFSYDRTYTTNTAFSRFINTFFSHSDPFKITCGEEMAVLFKQLACSLETQSNLSDEIATSVLKLIFCNIYTHNTKETSTDFSTNESYLIKIDDIINDFQSDISLQSLADALHLSTKQTSRILQKNYKKKLSEIMTEKRLSVATELLLRSQKTIPQIVEYINFPSERYFYLQFKKYYGCTPHKYRKNIQTHVNDF